MISLLPQSQVHGGGVGDDLQILEMRQENKKSSLVIPMSSFPPGREGWRGWGKDRAGGTEVLREFIETRHRALIPGARAGLESQEGSKEVAEGHYAGLKAQQSQSMEINRVSLYLCTVGPSENKAKANVCQRHTLNQTVCWKTYIYYYN